MFSMMGHTLRLLALVTVMCGQTYEDRQHDAAKKYDAKSAKKAEEEWIVVRN